MDRCEVCGSSIAPTGLGSSIGQQPTRMSGECTNDECRARYWRTADDGDWIRRPSTETEGPGGE